MHGVHSEFGKDYLAGDELYKVMFIGYLLIYSFFQLYPWWYQG